MKRWFREPVSGLLHLGGALLSAVGLIWLVVQTRDEEAKLASVAVYGVSLVLLFSASSAMHLYKGTRRQIDRLNRLDHASIYVLAAVWALAAAGVVYKLAIGPGRRSSARSTLLYVGMGWMAVLILPELIRLLPPAALVLIVAGGLAYTVGALIYMFDDPDVRPGFGLHEIWHLFVLTGSGFHFAAIAAFVV